MKRGHVIQSIEYALNHDHDGCPSLPETTLRVVLQMLRVAKRDQHTLRENFAFEAWVLVSYMDRNVSEDLWDMRRMRWSRIRSEAQCKRFYDHADRLIDYLRQSSV